MNGWEAESDAATLLNGLGVGTEYHYSHDEGSGWWTQGQGAACAGAIWQSGCSSSG